MVTKAVLGGLKVVVTRPKQQAQNLAKQLTQLGAEVIALPVIDVLGIEAQKWPEIVLSEQDMIIFVSRNAVEHFFAGLNETLAQNSQYVAVGAATANSMTEHGLHVDIEAPPPAGSESLLAMPAMEDMAGKQVLIVRGETGRELLANTLMARGAKISYLEVYQRCLASPTSEMIGEARTADCIIITSVAGLDNLCRILDDDRITTKTLIVVSDRIRQHAIHLGFQHIYVADDVKDAAMVQQVIEIGRKNGKKC